MIIQALCNSFKAEVFRGIHQPTDEYRIALYDESADLSKATEAYTADGEVGGVGYLPGGIPLVGFEVTLDGDVAVMSWTTTPVWMDSTITARGALIYNATRQNRAVGVFNFGHDVVSTNGPFTVNIPAATAAAAVIRFA